jgi:hypothetical protein
LISSILLSNYLIQQTYVSESRISNLNWYIEDLESQEFIVDYTAQSSSAPINQNVNSYQEFLQKAKEINATIIYFHGGGMPNSIFFINPIISISTHVEGYSWYLFHFNLDSPLPLSTS